MKLFVALLWLWMAMGCGYKPLAAYTKPATGEKIYTEVKVSLSDPENSVLLAESLQRAVKNTLKASVVSKEEADSQLLMRLGKVRFEPMRYDRLGYVVQYKTKVKLSTTFIPKDGKHFFKETEGEYDFSIASNSIVSDAKRLEAIDVAATKALEAMLFALALRSNP